MNSWIILEIETRSVYHFLKRFDLILDVQKIKDIHPLYTSSVSLTSLPDVTCCVATVQLSEQRIRRWLGTIN